MQQMHRRELHVWEAVIGAANVAIEVAESIASYNDNDNVNRKATTETSKNAVDVLELSLRILRELSGMAEGEEESSQKEKSDDNDHTTPDSEYGEGIDYSSTQKNSDPYVRIVSQLLWMLWSLPPIHGSISGNRTTDHRYIKISDDGDTHSATSTPNCRKIQTRFPSLNVYTGYRSDIIGALGNIVYRRTGLQDAVRRHESGVGLELILSHCAPDEDATNNISTINTNGKTNETKSHNPFLREWALFCIRNLTEGNESNQKAIRELQLLEAAQNETISELGLEVSVNKQTMKPEIIKRAQK